MLAEKKLLLASLLNAVAQQEAKNVKYLNAKPSRMARISEQIAAESRLYVASEGFEEMCEMVGVDAAELRKKNPDDALEAYQRVVEGKYFEQD